MANKNGGYTLIELMVSISVFAIVMMLAAGAYFSLLGLTRSAQGLSTAMDSVSFALETMTREIRTGTHFNCNSANGGNCALGGTSFYVLDQNGASVGFSRSTSSGVCGGSSTGCLVETFGPNTAVLTDPSVSITALTFYVSGTAKNDSAQPTVTIVVSGTVLTNKTTTPFTVETGATMRGPDL